MRNLIKAIMAGVCISIGGTSYLSVDNKIIGAALFSIGLLLICYLDFDLYTGKVCYLRFDSAYMKKSIGYISVVVIGNAIGAIVMGLSMSFIKPELHEKAIILCESKLSEEWMVIPLSILCNFMIFFAVQMFKKQQESFVRIGTIILCIMVFILCGFEHSIANIFYIAAARIYGWKMLVYLLLNIIFNGIGGILIYRLYKQTLQLL